jgi:hypothetical protein
VLVDEAQQCEISSVGGLKNQSFEIECLLQKVTVLYRYYSLLSTVLL